MYYKIVYSTSAVRHLFHVKDRWVLFQVLGGGGRRLGGGGGGEGEEEEKEDNVEKENITEQEKGKVKKRQNKSERRAKGITGRRNAGKPYQ